MRDAELRAQEIRVRFRGSRRDAEVRTYLDVRVPRGDQFDDLPLALGNPDVLSVRHDRRGAAIGRARRSPSEASRFSTCFSSSVGPVTRVGPVEDQPTPLRIAEEFLKLPAESGA